MCALLSSKLKQHAPEALPWGNRNQKLNDKISVTKKNIQTPKSFNSVSQHFVQLTFERWRAGQITSTVSLRWELQFIIISHRWLLCSLQSIPICSFFPYTSIVSSTGAWSRFCSLVEVYSPQWISNLWLELLWYYTAHSKIFCCDTRQRHAFPHLPNTTQSPVV